MNVIWGAYQASSLRSSVILVFLRRKKLQLRWNTNNMPFIVVTKQQQQQQQLQRQSLLFVLSSLLIWCKQLNQWIFPSVRHCDALAADHSTPPHPTPLLKPSVTLRQTLVWWSVKSQGPSYEISQWITAVRSFRQDHTRTMQQQVRISSNAKLRPLRAAYGD